MLLHLAWPKTFEEFKTLKSTGTTYDNARTKLNKHLKPKEKPLEVKKYHSP